jgi:peptidoglycan hydrolase-like protein with peptidoglycan-binding domain
MEDGLGGSRGRSARGSVLRWLVAGVVALATLVGAFWAGRVTMGPAAEGPADVESVVHEVVGASVGRSLSLGVTVEQPSRPVATNGLGGTVTSVGSTDQVDVGDSLYEVDTVPVRAVVGDTPFWRDLGVGLDGDDVAQLQEALAVLGHYRGEVDGRFQLTTDQAVRAWQADLGLTRDGVVRLGELVAVPRLPARLGLAEGIIAGARLAGGEPAVFAATGEIDFRLVISTGQAELIPPDAVVALEHDAHTWQAVLGESEAGDDGNIRYTLAAPDGGPVCGDECDSLPVAERTSLRARVTIVPEVSGPAVPVAALRIDPDGTAYVFLVDRTRQEVSVLGSSGGVAVVDGLRIGDRVLVLGAPAGGAPPGPAEEETTPAGGDEGGDGAGG